MVTKQRRTTLTGASEANSASDDGGLPNLTDSSGSDEEEVAATKPKAARISWRQKWRNDIDKLEADSVRQCKARTSSNDLNEWAQGVANRNEKATDSDAEMKVESPGPLNRAMKARRA